MAEGFADWEDVIGFALTLPATEMGTCYGRPTPKVGGKGFVGIGHEPDTSFVLMISIEEKTMLIEIAPQVFWETAHYQGYGAVLVRFGQGEREWVETLIARAWWDKASRAVRAAFGARP